LALGPSISVERRTTAARERGPSGTPLIIGK